MSNHSLKHLSETIKITAAECGLDQIGFAPVHPVENPDLHAG